MSVVTATLSVITQLRADRRSCAKPERVALHFLTAFASTRPCLREWECPIDSRHDPDVVLFNQAMLSILGHVQRIAVRSHGAAEPSVKALRRDAHDGCGPVRAHEYLAIFRNDALQAFLMRFGGAAHYRAPGGCEATVFFWRRGLEKVNEKDLMQLTRDLVNRLFGAHATFGPRLTGGYTITTETGGKVVVLENEIQSVTGTAEEQTAAAALARELWGESAAEDEPLEDLSERRRLRHIADPETPRKPCAAELGSSADAGAGGKAV